jgi:predicted alpha/beta hydrolase family esterase
LNARYDEWVIIFERILDHIQDSLGQNIPWEGPQVVFIGHSLGGCFLLTYLSSFQGYQRFQSFVTPWMQIIFHSIAGCISAGDFLWPITWEDWARFTQIASNYTYHLWHSKDDTIVPFTDATQILTRVPVCVFHSFTDQFHFVGSYFPELQQAIFDTV